MNKKPITEDMRLQDEWYKRAYNMKPNDFPEFFRELTEDYEHDYGTVCHAMAAIGLAAMRAFNKSEGARGGITGFQAGCVMWQVILHMNYENNKCGLKILDMDNLLYPQHEYKFRTIDEKTWRALQKEVRKKISESKEAREKYLKDMEQYKRDLEQFKTNAEAFAPREPHDNSAHPAVMEHWQSIAAGKVPFGLRIEG